VRRGERVDIIRQLADRLEQLDSPDELALFLAQFEFSPTDPDYWEGTHRGYLLHHLQQGSDERLVELHEHVSGDSARSLLAPSDLPWEPGTIRLFLSHTSAHAELAGAIRAIFLPWRVDAFVAHTTIEPSREWEAVIQSALASCDAMTGLITEDFQASAWCDQEVGYCLARRVPIVPVKLDANPHGFIAKYQAASPRPPGTAPWIADVIFRSLARHPAIRNRMAGPVVYRYASSRSGDGARANFELLRDVPPDAWTRELVEVAERASDENAQINHANVLDPEAMPMPEAVAVLLTPHRERLGMNTPPPTLDDDIPF
jgi:hypothetical protein